MTSIELNAYRAEIIRQLFDTDSFEVLDKIKQTLDKAKKYSSSYRSKVLEAKEDLSSYTMEEINAWIDKAEDEYNAGLGCTNDEINEQELKEMPWLTK
ncbi:MAG: hypothetical protein PHC95_08140 [Parabacteroides sp.]|nr:hypothetical protein [Parabacteroides sp.]